MQYYHAALRHRDRDPLLCPVGALAYWLVLSLGDLRRDSAGFPAPLVVIHHEGTSG
jgi:hypothetical protein